MTDDNLKIAMGVAIVVLLYLLTKKNKTVATVGGTPVSPGPGAGQAQPRRSNSMVTMLADTMGIKARRMEPNEDVQVLVGRFDSCPAGMTVAPDKNKKNMHGPGSCHVTCGGGGWCGDEAGIGSDGTMVLQKCCVPN